jgi:riboflavin synthase
MFTGLVESLGEVKDVRADGDGRHLVVAAPLAAALAIGESVAVNGACLTVVTRAGETFHVQAGPETLRRTNLGDLRPGDRVNLERSLRLSDRLGGHLVQGHVDGVGAVAARERQGDWETIWFSCPPPLARQMVPKGSIAVDGVSLTVVEVDDERFTVSLIPETLGRTTLGSRRPGDRVNLEVDVLAKYVERLLPHTGRPSRPQTPASPGGTA